MTDFWRDPEGGYPNSYPFDPEVNTIGMGPDEEAFLDGEDEYNREEDVDGPGGT